MAMLENSQHLLQFTAMVVYRAGRCVCVHGCPLVPSSPNESALSPWKLNIQK